MSNNFANITATEYFFLKYKDKYVLLKVLDQEVFILDELEIRIIEAFSQAKVDYADLIRKKGATAINDKIEELLKNGLLEERINVTSSTINSSLNNHAAIVP